MAVTTLSGAISGLQRDWQYIKNLSQSSTSVGLGRTLWAATGFFPAGSYDTTLNGVALTAPITGQFPHPTPASGNAHLARITARNSTAGVLIVADRLWHNGGYTITSTSAQNSTTPAWPARDIAGSTNGDGVLLAVEVSAATGAGTPTITISYTNQAGTAGKSGTNIVATTASTGTSVTHFIGLQAGDTGVRSVQSLTLSATWTSGTINMVAFRPLAMIPVKTSDVYTDVGDLVSICMPRMYDGSVPYLIYMDTSTSNAGAISGVYGTTHG